MIRLLYRIYAVVMLALIVGGIFHSLVTEPQILLPCSFGGQPASTGEWQ